MKLLTLTIFFGFLLFTRNYAQINESNVTVKSIRSVSRSARYDKNLGEFEKKPGVEFELVTDNPDGFYIGSLYWCLQIGNLKGIVEGRSNGQANGSRTIFFVLAKKDWKKLKNGDPLRISWGCPTPSEYEKKKPFAYLNKKMLDKSKLPNKDK